MPLFARRRRTLPSPRSTRPAARPAVAAQVAAAAGSQELEARRLLTAVTLTAGQNLWDVDFAADVASVTFAAGASGSLEFGRVAIDAQDVAGDLEVMIPGGAAFGDFDFKGRRMTGAVTPGDVSAHTISIGTGDGDDVIGDLTAEAGEWGGGRVSVHFGGGLDGVGTVSARGDGGEVGLNAYGDLTAGDVSAAAGDSDDEEAGAFHASVGGDRTAGDVSATAGGGEDSGWIDLGGDAVRVGDLSAVTTGDDAGYVSVYARGAGGVRAGDVRAEGGPAAGRADIAAGAGAIAVGHVWAAGGDGTVEFRASGAGLSRVGAVSATGAVDLDAAGDLAQTFTRGRADLNDAPDRFAVAGAFTQAVHADGANVRLAGSTAGDVAVAVSGGGAAYGLGVSVRGALNVTAGAGGGAVRLRDARLGSLAFVGSQSADTLAIVGGTVAGAIAVDGRGGDDVVGLRRVTAGNVRVDAGSGNDRVGLNAVAARGSVYAGLGHGHDAARLWAVNAAGTLGLAGGGGHDRLTVQRGAAARVAVDAGAGRDRVVAERVTGSSALSVKTGVGGDRVTARELAGSDVAVDLGGDADDRLEADSGLARLARMIRGSKGARVA